MAHDVKSISGAQGIGKKTAEKLIIELKDKLSIEDVLERGAEPEDATAAYASNQIQTEAVQALVALGYGNAEALKAVKRVNPAETSTVEELLKQALKYLF